MPDSVAKIPSLSWAPSLAAGRRWYRNAGLAYIELAQCHRPIQIVRSARRYLANWSRGRKSNCSTPWSVARRDPLRKPRSFTRTFWIYSMTANHYTVGGAGGNE
jgi:hypothetical protein